MFMPANLVGVWCLWLKYTKVTRGKKLQPFSRWSAWSQLFWHKDRILFYSATFCVQKSEFPFVSGFCLHSHWAFRYYFLTLYCHLLSLVSLPTCSNFLLPQLPLAVTTLSISFSLGSCLFFCLTTSLPLSDTAPVLPSPRSPSGPVEQFCHRTRLKRTEHGCMLLCQIL